jgi:1,2-diacylglycerol 3-beta-glucosyltransferase
MLHWFVVIPWVMLKMSLLPKTLVWKKTAHAGSSTAAALASFQDVLDDDVVVSPEG